MFNLHCFLGETQLPWFTIISFYFLLFVLNSTSSDKCLHLIFDMNNNENLVVIDDDQCRRQTIPLNGSQQQPHDSSFSSDDTEFLGLPSSQAATSQRSVHDVATQLDQLTLFSHMIAFVDSNDDDSDANAIAADNVSLPSTTPTPSISSRESTPIACNKFNCHCVHHISPEWSSSDENTTFYGDKNSILSSACDAERRLATSEYFKSSCGGYLIRSNIKFPIASSIS